MKGKELNRSLNKRRALLWMVMAACLTLTGCARFGPIVLNKAVIRYDASVLQSEQQLLLLNIIRMHDDQPPHFTVTSGISATFTLAHTGGLNSSISGNSSTNIYGYTSGLTLAKTVSDSPTITITPMQGKDYALRLFAPIDTAFVNTLFLQRREPRLDKMLRLMGKNFYMMPPEKAKEVFELIRLPVKNSEGKMVKYTYPYDIPFPNPNDLKDKDLNDWGKKKGITGDEALCLLASLIDDGYMENNPSKKPLVEGAERKDILHYEFFRKVASHIQAMALTNRLYFYCLDFYVPNEGIEGTSRTIDDLKKDGIKDTIDALEKQYRWEKTEEGQKTKPEKEGFMLTNKSKGDVKGSFIAADNLTVKDMKDTIAALEGYHWEKISQPVKKKEAFRLTKRYPIMAITDFDFDEMADKMGYKDTKKLLEKIQKHLELKGEIELGEGMIIVLLRGDQDNRWPIYGYFTLRNFKQVLQFLAESLTDQPGYASEYDVPPSQFTEELLNRFTEKDKVSGEKKEKLPRECLDNPALTLTIKSASEMTTLPPRDRLVDFSYNGKLFWISSPRGQTGAQLQPKEGVKPWVNLQPPRWDKEVFGMLYEIYQFNNVAPVVSTPTISISK